MKTYAHSFNFDPQNLKVQGSPVPKQLRGTCNVSTDPMTPRQLGATSLVFYKKDKLRFLKDGEKIYTKPLSPGRILQSKFLKKPRVAKNKSLKIPH